MSTWREAGALALTSLAMLTWFLMAAMVRQERPSCMGEGEG